MIVNIFCTSNINKFSTMTRSQYRDYCFLLYVIHPHLFIGQDRDIICCRHCFRPPSFFFLNAISLSNKWKIIIVKLLLPTGIHFLVQVGMMKDLLKLCFKGFFHREELWPKGLLSAHHYLFTLLQYSQSFYSPRKCTVL